MQSLYERHSSVWLFQNDCETAQGKFLPFILPEESERLRHKCNSISENIVSCKDSSLETHLSEIDGMDLKTVHGRFISLPIPKFVPIITRDFYSFMPDTIPHFVIGVRLKDILRTQPRTKVGRIHLPKKLRLFEEILQRPIFKNKTIILFASGRDRLIEEVWNQRYDLDLAKTIQSMGISIVTGINFSLFPGECPVGHGINLKKSLKSIEYFQNAGLQAIPHVYFLNSNHIARWAEWLDQNPEVNLITINCQFSRKSEAALAQSEGIKILNDRLKRKVDFLLECPSKKLLRELETYDATRYIRVAAQQPSISSVFGRKCYIVQNRLKWIQTVGLPKAQTLHHNMKIYDNYIKSYALAKKIGSIYKSDQMDLQFEKNSKVTNNSPHQNKSNIAMEFIRVN